ncbi:UNVERIFIED_CONTAM: putative glycosyl hydrolase [Acetivibrio alkalicellulosi]
MYKLIKGLFSTFFLNTSVNKMALANSTGLLIGLLPLYGFRIAIAIVISIFFKLNLIALFMGVITAIICPILLNALIWTIDKLDTVKSITVFSYTINFDEIFFLSSHNKSILLLSVSTIILCVCISNIYFHSYYSPVFSYMSIVKKIGISSISTIGALLGFSLLSNGNIIGIIIIILIFLYLGFKYLGILAASIFGTVIIWSLTSIKLFWTNYGFSENTLALFISGLQSPENLIQIINGRQYQYFFVIIIYIVLSFISYPIFKRIYSFKRKNEEDLSKTYVFKDSTGERWSKIKSLSASFGVIILIITTLFSAGTLTNISFPIAFASRDERQSAATETNLINKKVQQMDRIESYGFYVNWDPKSKESLMNNIKSIDVLIPCWFQLNNELTIDSFVDKSIDKLAFENNIKVIPLINNYINDKWDNEALHKLLSSKENRKRLIDELHKIVKNNNYHGINIDFENLDEKDRDNFTLFMSELYSVFNEDGFLVIVDLPADDKAFDYSQLGKYADYVILMLYDEHATGTNPGPIASKNWFETCLANSQIPKEKIIVGIGSYGYDWTLGSDADAMSLTYEQVINTAISYNATFNWNKEYNNSEYRYFIGSEEHSLWYVDSLSLYNQILFSRKLGIDKFALWRLGSEDPSLWEIMGNTSDKDLCKEVLSQKPYTFEINYSYGNEVIDNISYVQAGTRSLQFDEHGFIVDVYYDTKSLEIWDRGEKSKRIALTFDDGPHPIYTPQILDTLKEHNVKATFFVTGKNAFKYPEIVKRIYEEGHDIGNHTYSHIDMISSSSIKMQFELNITQKIIEMITGHSTVYFRQPYNVDMMFSSPKQNEILKMINEMGYTIVGSFIDPKDWEGHSHVEIVNRVGKDVEKGSIVLLHDYGTYVNNTVEALPLLINMLEDKGYDLVSVSNLMDIERKEVMKPIKVSKSAYFAAIYYVLVVYNSFKHIISWILILATTIGIIRAIFLILFSTKQKKKYSQMYFKYNYNPLVSIVIAAYNEEKVICSTVHSILKSDYKNIEVLVVDDGSKDNTSKKVFETFNKNSKVRLIKKENGGKSSAVNKGFMEARGEIVIVIDADTILADNSVSLLVRHFENKNVAGVAGNVKIGNKNNLLTLWQHIEYVTGLNLERRAFDELNCIPVVPGAIGAWRKDLVASLGYYKEDTLAEDADVTIEFLKQGYKIVYEEGARAFTEAPEDIVSFIKQRLRWSYGTLQCLWKHRGSLFNPKNKMLGFIAMPHMWLYQFIFQLVSPITDILFVVGLLGKNPSASVVMYFAFLVMDLLVTLHAFRLEGESPKPLVWIVFQRIIYRQFMTYVVFKSMFCALKGVKVGWNKLVRKGNVKTQNERTILVDPESLSA